jgi:hypothetical protein
MLPIFQRFTDVVNCIIFMVKYVEILTDRPVLNWRNSKYAVNIYQAHWAGGVIHDVLASILNYFLDELKCFKKLSDKPNK